MYLKLILVVAFMKASYGQFLQCPWVSTLDCSRYPIQHLCGSDRITYDNRCDFAKVHCTDKNLHILGDGQCHELGIYPITSPPPDHTTHVHQGPTTTHKPVFLGHNVVLDFFCLELSHELCPKDTEMVCGDDNVTYVDFCEYEKARCTHRDLKVLHYGAC